MHTFYLNGNRKTVKLTQCRHLLVSALQQHSRLLFQVTQIHVNHDTNLLDCVDQQYNKFMVFMEKQRYSQVTCNNTQNLQRTVLTPKEIYREQYQHHGKCRENSINTIANVQRTVLTPQKICREQYHHCRKCIENNINTIGNVERTVSTPQEMYREQYQHHRKCIENSINTI